MIKRNTVQRMMVLDAVRALHCHATADEIYQEVSEKCPSISRATVYRNLQHLCELGEIAKREIPGSPDRYDHMTGNHSHVRCTKCGKVMDVLMSPFPSLEMSVTDSSGFLITGENIIFSGLCPECRKTINGPENE